MSEANSSYSHDFGGALAAIKSGKRVSRSGWNGKGMFIAFVHPDDYTVGGDIPGVSDGEESTLPRLLPWIGMKTADHGFVPWSCSQTDVLADDWGVVPDAA